MSSNGSVRDVDGEESGEKLETEDISGGPVKQAKGAVPAAQRGAIYTMLAREGVNAAELANAAMAKKTIGKAPVRHVEIAAPHGPSTSGGKRARQSITLAPVQGDGGTVMCGHMDIGQKAVELREYKAVSDQYTERYGAKLDFTADDYKKLMADLEVVLKTLQFSVTVEHEVAKKRSEPEAADPDVERANAGVKAVILVLVGVVVLLGGAAFLLR